MNMGGLRFHAGERLSVAGSPLPDPLFMQFLQEFSIKQGVGVSGSGLVKGSVPEKRYNGARSGPGLGMTWIGKREAEKGGSGAGSRPRSW